MLIDWFTVGAQALNFLVLVWLMKRFLYAPILGAIDAREKRIADELAGADTTRVQAQALRSEFEEKNAAFARERADLLAKATEDARDERRRLIDDARQAADALGAKRQEALRAESAAFNQSLTRQTQAEVFAIARQALTDLAGVTLEDRMIEVFSSRLREADDGTKRRVADALTAAPGVAVVRSAFELSAQQQGEVRRTIDEVLGTHAEVGFETVPDVVSGIELLAGGYKVGWSIDDYLASLERRIGELAGAAPVDASPGDGPLTPAAGPAPS